MRIISNYDNLSLFVRSLGQYQYKMALFDMRAFRRGDCSNADCDEKQRKCIGTFDVDFWWREVECHPARRLQLTVGFIRKVPKFLDTAPRNFGESSDFEAGLWLNA
jgi:hypothetical protein